MSTPLSITDPISLTARMTAAARARETRRADRLFEDPFAEALAGPEGFAFMDRLEAVVRPPGATGNAENPYIAIRTRVFDDFLADAVRSSGARQVVLVAAGLDSRAFRLDWPDGTRWFELDRPEVLHAKQEVQDRLSARPRCDRRPVGVDFLADSRRGRSSLAGPSPSREVRNPSEGSEVDWAGALTAGGFDASAPSVWLIEGLFPYLDEGAVGALLAQVRPLAAARSRLAADTAGRSMLESPWTQSYLQALARENAPWRFGTDQPEALLAAHGWRAVAARPGDPGASFGRWPYPVMPRDTPGLPQTFLITAVRE